MKNTMLDTCENNLVLSQKRQLERFGGKINKFGVNFAVCNAEGELVMLCSGDKFESDPEQLMESCQRVLKSNDNIEAACRVCDNGQFLAASLRLSSKEVGVAVIDLGDRSFADDSVQTVNPYLSEMLALLAENFQVAAKAEEQIEMVSNELSHTYEELVLLHKLSTNMKVTESHGNYLQMACDSLTDIVLVEGIAILLEKTVMDEEYLVLAAGSGLIDTDEQMTYILKRRMIEEIGNGKEALLDSEVDSPFKYDWSDNTRNIIAVPLYGKEKTKSHFSEESENDSNIIGMMVAINRIGKPDFDSADVKIFNSVANDCAVFIENGRLFKDLKELFIGSLKSLTSSIDAKDKYTRGHSERVAFISRWLAEKLAEEEWLDEDQIHKIYLAGLLHDIGKVGINDAVLCKAGKLTEEEYNDIKRHPLIGAGILGQIKQMHDIVPGVLCHHERVDGKGYPRGLVGDQIPLIGKVVGLADSFDAMTSKRTYRGPMNLDQAIAEIEKGLGSQYDKKLGGIFIKSDLYHLWDIMQAEFSKIYGNNNISEYGTVAVGALIR